MHELIDELMRELMRDQNSMPSQSPVRNAKIVLCPTRSGASPYFFRVWMGADRHLSEWS